MILQSDTVVGIIEEFRKEVPEYMPEFNETKEGLTILIDKNFDQLPDLTRFVLYTAINRMCEALQVNQVPFRLAVK